MLTKILFSVLCLLAITGMAQDGNPSGDPGFTEGVFDANNIIEQLNRNKCDGIRFYNCMLDDVVRVMGVSIENMADMNSGLFPGKRYIVAMGMTTRDILIDKINNGNANRACELVDQSRYHHYSTHFNKTDLETLLGKENCNALKITSGMNSGMISMEVHAVHFKDGVVTDLGQGVGFDLLCSDPCPPVCGPASNYVYFPR